MKYEFAHIGLNHNSAEEARKNANLLKELFGVSLRQGHGYIFVDSTIELRETWFQGKYGHIAYSVENVEDALEELKRKNVHAQDDTIVKNENNEIVSVYLNVVIAGFVVHLVKER